MRGGYTVQTSVLHYERVGGGSSPSKLHHLQQQHRQVSEPHARTHARTRTRIPKPRFGQHERSALWVWDSRPNEPRTALWANTSFHRRERVILNQMNPEQQVRYAFGCDVLLCCFCHLCVKLSFLKIFLFLQFITLYCALQYEYNTVYEGKREKCTINMQQEDRKSIQHKIQETVVQ